MGSPQKGISGFAQSSVPSSAWHILGVALTASESIYTAPFFLNNPLFMNNRIPEFYLDGCSSCS